MMTIENIKIDANDLNKLLRKQYGKTMYIVGADIADPQNASTPEYKAVGVGGVLTLHVAPSPYQETDERTEEEQDG